MAIAVDSSSKFSADLTNANPHSYTGATINAPNGARCVVVASVSAASGHPLSDINFTDSHGFTWTLHKKLRQANGGANCPIGIWSTVVDGSSFTVTQTDTDAGFSMVQGVWVLTGAGSVIDAQTFTGTGAASISLTATAAGQLAVFAMNDWQNSQDTPVHASGSMTDRLVVPGTVDHQSCYLGDLFSTGAGAFSVGTNVLAHPSGTNAVAILVAAQSSNTIQGSAVGGSWWSLVNIGKERAHEYNRSRTTPPLACPNDGEPLRQGKNGSLHCPFDGWEWPRDSATGLFR